MNFIKENKKAITSVIISFLIGFMSCFFGIRQKTEIKTEIVEKIVTKVVTVEVEKSNAKKDTYTKIVEKVDGTKETFIKETTETQKESLGGDLSMTSSSAQKTIIETNDSASIGIIFNIDNESVYKDYGFSFQYEVVDSIWLQSVYMFKEKDLLLGLFVTF